MQKKKEKEKEKEKVLRIKGKLHFATLNYHHFFNPPPKFQKVMINPPIASNCTAVTPESKIVLELTE